MIFAEINGQIRLYHDSGGLKSTFYYAPPDEEEIWLATQPWLFTELFGLKRDRALCEEFFAHRYQNSWPCELTPYPNVRQLLPNHYLDLQVREAKRFWPTQNVGPMSIEDAATSMAKTIKGIVASATYRGPVALPLTGGYESRVTFSCIGELRKTIPMFLITGPNSLHHDTVISKRLARRFGVSVSHHRVSRFSHEEWELLLQNTGDIFWDPAANFIFTFGEYYKDHAILVGAMGTVARAWLYKDGLHPIALVAPA